MAATLVEERRINLDESMVLCFGTVTLDNSYPTGGEPIDAIGDFGYLKVFFEGAQYSLAWDKANQKIVARNGTSEVANATDLSAVSADYVALAIR